MTGNPLIMTDYEIYTTAKALLTREYLGERQSLRSNRLYEECKRRNIKIWDTAVLDAIKISSSIETVYENFNSNHKNHTRIISINRIDFCNPLELSKLIGFQTEELSNIIKVVDKDFFCSTVKGDSMIGRSGINPNDTLIIKKTNRIKDDAIVLVEVEGKKLIKRISYQHDHILLKSDNPKYETMQVELGEVKPFGVVRFIIKEADSTNSKG